MLKKYYTTKMSDSAKQLQIRFYRIRGNTSKKSKIVSALISIILIFTTLCAGVVIAAFENTPKIEYEVYNFDEKIELTYSPFIYDGEYYLPLRNVLNGFGIEEINYNNGKINIKLPNYDNMPGECELKIGENIVYLPTVDSGIVMRSAPILSNENVTYVNMNFFEILMPLTNCFNGFRLNVIRPTEPEYYYSKSEEVFIGTAAEQDNYNPIDELGNPKLVKRILVDENNKTIAVIPIENQIPENITQKFERVGSAMHMQNFSQFWESATFLVLQDDTHIIKTNFYKVHRKDSESDELGEEIAYLAPADFITPIIENKFNKGYKSLITNTYKQ